MTAVFEVPAELHASAPPPERDGVRLLVASPERTSHTTFAHISEYLIPGDLVVVNTSATLAAAVDGERAYKRPVTVHFSAELDDGTWAVEVRPRDDADGPVPDAHQDEVVTLPAGARLRLLNPHPAEQRRLWRASIGLEGGVAAYLGRVGRPIRYSYVPRTYPLADYQTVFGREPGSAEMPSAGRPFTDRTVTDLVTRGIAIAPILLHTGVSSQTTGEPPQPERFAVPAPTARLVNHTHAAGGRIVAIGTTVTRALESAADETGTVRARSGWTELVLGQDRPARVVDGLVTGWHEPGASHLKLLEAVAGRSLVNRAYDEALAARYLWHEFGDSCLLLP